MSDRFDSQDYAGKTTKLPTLQLANKEEPSSAGMIVTMDNAELAGFDPDTSKIWRKHTHRFRSGPAEVYISQAPRLMVFRQGPLVLRERNSDRYLGEFVKERYNKATMYTSMAYLVFVVDEKNKILHSNPFKLSTKGSFSYAFGEAHKSWAKALSDSYIKAKNPESKQQRGEKFTGLGVFSFKLEPTLKGDKEQSWVCDVTSFDKPDEKTWEKQFLGYDDNVYALIDQAYKDTETYFDYSESENEADEVATKPQSAFDTFLEYLDKAANEVQVEQARAWIVGKQGESLAVTNAVSEALLRFKPVATAPVSSGGEPANFDDVPF